MTPQASKLLRPKRAAGVLQRAGEIGVAIILFVLLIALLSPRVSDIRTTQGSITKSYDHFPVQLPSTTGSLTVNFTLTTLPFQDKKFLITIDDCLESLSVNGRQTRFHDCDSWTKRHTIIADISPYLDTNNNSITAVIKDVGPPEMGFIDFSGIQRGPANMIVDLAILAMLLIAGWRFCKRMTADRVIIAIVMIGILVRWHYVLDTLFFIRTNDVDSYQGHIDYVRFLALHWHLPPASGWEYHQAPLFYLLCAPILYLTTITGSTLNMMALQCVSLVISCATVLVQAWIGCRLFKREDQSAGRRIFTALCTFQGVFMMFSSQVSNDVLLLFLLSLGCARLMVWRETGNTRDWYACVVLAVLAFLTKTSGIILFIVVLCFLACDKRLGWKPKISLALRSMMWFLVFTAWLPLTIFTESPHDVDNYVTAGIYNVSQSNSVRSLSDYLTFNPVKILDNTNIYAPYNERSKFMWEYLFRTSAFGEHLDFNLQALMWLILLNGILLLPWVAAGIVLWPWKRNREADPMIALGLLSVGCMLLYVMQYQNSFHQNFRLTSISALAMAYFLSLAIEELTYDIRWTGILLTITKVSLLAVFIFWQ